MPISVVINTYNAADTLTRTLESVKEFDEIVVCDMESTDDTIKIAHEYGCKVITFPKGNYNICEPARNFAIHSASSEWVLVVDADELVTPQLREYLYSASSATTHSALCIPRKNFMLYKFVSSAYPDYQIRFLRKDKVTWPPTIHSHPIVDGTTGSIPKERTELALVHLQDTMHGRINKLNVYSDNEAIRREGKSVSTFDLIFKPLARFIKMYIFHGGFRLGKVGYIQAQQDAFYKLIVLTKMLEKQWEKEMK